MQPDIAAFLPERFEFRRELGEGGMGQVVLAFDRLLGREVAVKVLAPWRQDEREVARFQREAEDLARLGHPNIVRFLAVAHHQGRDYIAMDYIAGRDLGSVARSSSLRCVLNLFAQVCDGLQHIHEHGLVHRDLKPHNVLVTPEGVARITDLGLARRVESYSSLTRPGAVLGSADYMAPEQASSSKVGPAADLYALGVCLYEALTGRLPHAGESVPSPRTLRPELSVELSSLLLGLLKLRPEKRPGSAAEVAAALRACPECRPPLGPTPVRARELAQLETWLQRGESVLLLGASGSGRSYLVRWLERRLSDAGRPVRRLRPRDEAPLECVRGLEPGQTILLVDDFERFSPSEQAWLAKLPPQDWLISSTHPGPPATHTLELSELDEAQREALGGAGLPCGSPRELHLMLLALRAASHPGSPQTPLEALLAELERLGPEALQVVRAASLLDEPFELELARAASGLDLPVVERALAQLVSQGYLEEDEDWYRFTHAEIQASLRAAVPERTRRRICITAARSLADRQAWPARIARLLERGEQPARPYWEKAVTEAQSRGAAPETAWARERL